MSCFCLFVFVIFEGFRRNLYPHFQVRLSLQSRKIFLYLSLKQPLRNHQSNSLHLQLTKHHQNSLQQSRNQLQKFQAQISQKPRWHLQRRLPSRRIESYLCRSFLLFHPVIQDILKVRRPFQSYHCCHQCTPLRQPPPYLWTQSRLSHLAWHFPPRHPTLR